MTDMTYAEWSAKTKVELDYCLKARVWGRGVAFYSLSHIMKLSLHLLVRNFSRVI